MVFFKTKVIEMGVDHVFCYYYVDLFFDTVASAMFTSQTAKNILIKKTVNFISSYILL